MEVRIALTTSQYQAMRRFYEDVLAFPVEREWDRGAGDRGVIYPVGSTLLEILEGEAGSVTEANEKYLNLGSAIFELAQASAEIYQSCPTDTEKRELLKAVFLNVKIKDGNIVPDYKNGLELVAARAKNNDWLGGRVWHQNL